MVTNDCNRWTVEVDEQIVDEPKHLASLPLMMPGSVDGVPASHPKISEDAFMVGKPSFWK